MKIVFFGSSKFAVPSLERLLDSPHKVLAVVTQPDRKKGRRLKVQATPAKERASSENINIYRDRLSGFLKAMEDNGIKPVNGQVLKNVITKERGKEETDRMINVGFPFDAIFAASDFSALGALLSLKDHKVKVPGEVGVAGFANEPFTELLEITTVEQRSTEIGRSAAGLLFEWIDSEQSVTSKEILIKPEIIIRNSTLKTA